MAAQRIKAVGDELSSESFGIVPALKKIPVASVPVITVNASRGFKINLGDFQNMDTSVGVTVTVPEDTDLDSLAIRLAEIIDTLQSADMELAHNITNKKNAITRALFDE